MNQERRAALQQAITGLEKIKQEIDALAKQEAEARDALPENLYGSVRYNLADKAVVNMESAIDSVADAVQRLRYVRRADIRDKLRTRIEKEGYVEDFDYSSDVTAGLSRQIEAGIMTFDDAVAAVLKIVV